MAEPPAPPRSLLPWRRAWPAWALAGLFLVIAVPTFLRMPPWCDLTLYDVAAHTVLAGGVHYRDVFDTNLPGFVWALTAIRFALGDGYEVVRAVDLLVVGGECALILLLARRAGAGKPAVAWAAAGMAVFYPYTTEFNHAQRDVWMLLPALAATLVRLRRLRGGGGSVFVRGVAEGLLWGVAVWVKPHVVFPAAAVWLLTARRLNGTWRKSLPDYLGNVAGGLLVGAAGVLLLVLTGTWKPFWDVFTTWNNYYLGSVFGEFGWRVQDHLYYFAPWSFMQPAALVIAVRELVRRPATDAGVCRTALYGLFLAWVFQAFAFQRRFHYAHVPETLLMFAVFAVRGWAAVPAGLVYLVLSTGLMVLHDESPKWRRSIRKRVDAWTRLQQRLDAGMASVDHRLGGWANPDLLAYAPKHPLAWGDRWRWWPGCFTPGLPGDAYGDRADALAMMYHSFPSVTVREVIQVADELRRLGAKEGEVLCWHDSPHAVYLELGHRPPFRFMHVTTTLMGDPHDPKSPQFRMRLELHAALPGVKYVVTDLRRLFLPVDGTPTGDRWTEAGPDLLPPVVTGFSRHLFPFDQPAIFRSGGGHGRYLIHRLSKPVTHIEYDVPNVWGS